jgi:hypothetical protein
MFPRAYFTRRYFPGRYFTGRDSSFVGLVFKVKLGSDSKGQRWASVFVKQQSPPHFVTQYLRLLPPGPALTVPEVGDRFILDPATDRRLRNMREAQAP